MRRPASCHWCGRTTTAKSRVCPECLHTDLHQEVDPRDGLRGGYWRPHGAVQVWVRA